MAEKMYEKGKRDLFDFMKKNEASHYHRLMGFGLEKDIRYCLSHDAAYVLPVYEEGKLMLKLQPIQAEKIIQDRSFLLHCYECRIIFYLSHFAGKSNSYSFSFADCPFL